MQPSTEEKHLPDFGQIGESVSVLRAIKILSWQAEADTQQPKKSGAQIIHDAIR